MKDALKVWASLLGAILLVITGASVSFWTLGQMDHAAETRQHRNQIIKQSTTLLSECIDAESGQRGYLLTGDESFLEPYLLVRDNIASHLHALRQLTVSGPAQELLNRIVPLINDKLEHMSKIVALSSEHDTTAAVALIRKGQGKWIMDEIRSNIHGVIQYEENDLLLHETQFYDTMHRLFIVIIITSILTLAFALSFAQSVHRESQHCLNVLLQLETKRLLENQQELSIQLQKSNNTLLESQEKLAVTLHSIGDAVITTNADACVTMMNPVAEHLTGWAVLDAIGQPVKKVFHIVHKDTRKSAVIPVMDALALGTAQGLANHTVLITREGAEFDIADSCAPIRDRDHQVVGAVLVFRNVTTEYAVQQTLRDSATLIQTILNTVVDGIITFHCHSCIINTANPAIERMFGYTVAELIGQHVGLLMPEFDNNQNNCSLDYFNATAEALAIGRGREVIGKRKDGSYFPLEIAVTDIAMGGQPHFTGVLRDISARKQAEEALLKAGALQSAIFNSANFSSIATDTKGVIQIFNVGAERLFGYTAAEVINKMTPADLHDLQEMIARATALSLEFSTPIMPGFEALVFKASRGIEDVYEMTKVRKDGSRFPAVLSVSPLRDAQKSIIGYLLIGIDNTARKQVEEEQQKLDQRLRDQQFYTRSLIESNIDALMATDPHGIITDVNKQMEELTDSTRDELIGAPFKNYFTDPERAEAGIKLVLSEKKVTNYELVVRARDGKETVVSYNATTFYDRDRKLQGVFAAARDVTVIKINEQTLLETNAELEKAKYAAEKANLAKSDFLSSMSHELRSPLNAILGFAQLMDSSVPLPSDNQKESIAQILQAGWHLLQLINEILDLAVIESGKVSLVPESVSLTEVLRECHTMMEPLALERHIQLTFNHISNPLFVHADRTRLKQIIINLLSNAIKYNQVNGTVIVNCTICTKCTDCAPGHTRMSIKDSGIGMSPEKLEQLYQPFNRLGQEGSTVVGTGIGLVVTRRLVELMKGSLGVASTVGVGTTFWCDFISATAPDHESSDASIKKDITPSIAHSIQQSHLLYIEDNPANMKLVEQLITRRPDIELLTAINGTIGVELARTAQPTVILMDINLPGISGIDALKILLKDPVTAHIPVIALSANAMPRDIELGIAAGFFDYLTKPIRVNEFMDALNKALIYAERNKL